VLPSLMLFSRGQVGMREGRSQELGYSRPQMEVGTHTVCCVMHCLQEGSRVRPFAAVNDLSVFAQCG
jgi:hypothetical protein